MSFPLLLAFQDAAETASATVSTNGLGQNLLTAIIFTVIGLILFAACLWLVVKFAPFSVQKEIEEDQNISLGIIIGSMILGIAIILAAAIHG